MRQRTTSSIIFDSCNIIFMALLFLIFTYPFIYIISYSFSEQSQISGGMILWPRGFTLDAYMLVFSNPSTLSGLFISMARTISGPVIMVFFTSMAAYCLTRNDLAGVRFFRRFFVFTLYFSSGLIPYYLMIKTLHLSGSFLVYIIPSAISVFNMILIKTYIESLPKELEESGFIDGANDIVIYWKIIFPICTPVIAAVVLFEAVGHWNSFVDTQLYNSMNRKLFTLQYVLYQTLSATTTMQGNHNNTHSRVVSPQSLKMAITIITVIPITFVYPFLQRHFAKGLLIGSVKG